MKKRQQQPPAGALDGNGMPAAAMGAPAYRMGAPAGSDYSSQASGNVQYRL
jgi:hypothetical protein